MSIIWLVAQSWRQRRHPDHGDGQGQGSHADDAGQELAMSPQLLGQHDRGQHDHGGQVHHAHDHEQRHQRPQQPRQYAPWWAPARTSRSRPR